MVVAAAREISDGELVFAGMRLPVIAFAIAQATHAPRARALFELGLLRDRPAEAFLGTMGDPPNVSGASWATRTSNAMALMAQGTVDLGFIGGAEVDRFGNLNTSYIGPREAPAVKLPGSGGGADIAVLSRRWITLMAHEPRRLVQRVSYVTSPGHGDGTPGWRRRRGLLGGGPSAIVTTLGVLRFPVDSGEAELASVHPGVGVDEVRAATGWDLQVRQDVFESEPPSPAEMSQIERFDPDGFWTGADG